MKVINRKWIFKVVAGGGGVLCGKCGVYLVQGDYAYRSLERSPDGFYDWLCKRCAQRYNMVEVEPPESERPPKGIICRCREYDPPHEKYSTACTFMWVPHRGIYLAKRKGK